MAKGMASFLNRRGIDEVRCGLSDMILVIDAMFRGVMLCVWEPSEMKQQYKRNQNGKSFA